MSSEKDRNMRHERTSLAVNDNNRSNPVQPFSGTNPFILYATDVDLFQMSHFVSDNLQTVMTCFLEQVVDAANFWFDIPERKQAEELLFSNERRYQTLYDNNPSMSFTVDADGTVLSVNRFGASYLGYSVEELLGSSLFKLYHKADRNRAKKQLKQLKQLAQIVTWELRMIDKHGHHIWVRETARSIESENGLPVILIVCEDINESHKLFDVLAYQATHDDVTDLINRREFERRLDHVFERLKTKPALGHVLCYMDLDHFKVINDTYGHVAGDELLRQLSHVLRKQLRQQDTLARLGGDEFGILMESCPFEKAQQIAINIHDTVGEFRFHWQGKNLAIGASIGMVSINEQCRTAINAMSLADASCFAAKEAGRNCIHIYSEADDCMGQRQQDMKWVEQINRALEEDRLFLWFQSIMPVSGKCEGIHYELLIRMKDEAGNIILPGAFLPAAERYGLSSKIDRWVIQTALSWLQATPEVLEKQHMCGINLSGQSMADEGLLAFVNDQLKHKEIPPGKVYFEITETAAIANLAVATRFITALRVQGCKFALDDFGSGLSSFAYLKNLPVDFLKIDGAFVKNMANDEVDFAMVKAINDVGQVLGKKTIAEFVEDNTILEKLKAIGVDYAQGYGLSKPKSLLELY